MKNDLHILNLIKRNYVLTKLKINMYNDEINEMDLLLSVNKGFLSKEEENDYICLIGELRNNIPSPEEIDNIEIPIDLWKLYKKLQVLIYDSSDNINCFYIGREKMWLIPSERTNYLLTVESAKKNNLEYIYFNGLWLSVKQVISALQAINIYAMECTNVKNTHVNNIMTLDSVQEVKNYDFTINWPEKLKF